MAKKKEAASPFVPVEEQPYKVPENWCWVRLGILVTTSKEKTEDFSDDTLKYVGLEHMEKDSGIIGYSTAADLKSLKSIFHTGQILSGKLRPYLNKHNIATFDGVCSTDILVFDATKCADNHYVNFYLNQRDFIEYAVSNSKGINLPRVSEAVVLDAVCPLPPLPEQYRIVSRIESLFAKLDEAKEKAQTVVDGFELRKSAILHKAFAGELTAKWRKEHEVGLESWCSKLFDDLIAKMQNGLAKRSGSIGREYIVLRLANLLEDGFDTSDLRKIVLDEKEQCAYFLCENDVVMIRVNGSKDNVGRQLLVSENTEWAFCDHIIRIKYDNHIVMPAYMVYFSKCRGYREYIADNMVSSAGQNTISRKGMSHLFIQLPTLPEQAEIVKVLERLLLGEQQAKEAAEAVLAQIDTMKKAILAHAFRGELGTNDPSEEWAGELLKRV